MSKGRVFLFHWHGGEAVAAAKVIEAWGWDVSTESEDGARGGAAVKANPPSAAVFYLTHKASHSRETAEYLAGTKATANIPLIFVGEEGEALDKTRARIPNSIFVTQAALQKALDRYAK